MASVLVSIINYRTAELTLAAVQSVLADFDASRTADQSFEGQVVIVDNASGDGSAEVLADWIADQKVVPVRLVCSEVNGGFSAGHNLGFASGRSEYVLVLNSDAELRPGCLAALLRAAEADPAAGLFAPRLEDADARVQTSTFRFPSAASEFIRGAQTGPVTAALRRWDVPLGPAPDAAQAGWASFACILLRRRMIEEIGPMDAGYFLYFEDVEFSLRARWAGWRLVLVPEARAVHHRGGSGPVKALTAERARLPRYYYASRTRYFYQRGGRLGLLAANLGWAFGRGIAQLRRLVGKPVPKAVSREGRDLWINARDPLGAPVAPGE
ncbi:MAG: glycosyltransferase family 2 protein [Pseudomonadota bacterium]